MGSREKGVGKVQVVHFTCFGKDFWVIDTLLRKNFSQEE